MKSYSNLPPGTIVKIPNIEPIIDCVQYKDPHYEFNYVINGKSYNINDIEFPTDSEINDYILNHLHSYPRQIILDYVVENLKRLKHSKSNNLYNMELIQTQLDHIESADELTSEILDLIQSNFINLISDLDEIFRI